MRVILFLLGFMFLVVLVPPHLWCWKGLALVGGTVVGSLAAVGILVRVIFGE